MKRKILTAILAATMAVGLAACGGSPAAEKITSSDIALTDGDGATVVEYRMTREEVEKTLGLPDVIDTRWLELDKRVDYGDVSVWYASDMSREFYEADPGRAYNLSTITAITTTGTKYQTVRGISVGDTMDDVIKAYGLPHSDYDTPIEKSELKAYIADSEALAYATELDGGAQHIEVDFILDGGKVAKIEMSHEAE